VTTLNLQVAVNSDDAVQFVSSGGMNLFDPVAFGSDLSEEHNGIRFTGVSGLSGSTIDSATLTFRASATDSGAFIGDWFAEDAEAPPTFTTTVNNITDRTQTTATCEGDGTDFGNWTSGADETFTGDGVNTIADIIQELADSYDPSTIVLLHIFTSGTGERVALNYFQDAALAPKLDIDHSAAVVAAARPAGTLAGMSPAIL